MYSQAKKGFTLTELLIVISILVFLGAIILAMTRGQVFKGNDARRKGDLHKIKVAVEEYEKDHDCYPLPQLVVCKPGNGLSPYLDKIPCDPATNASYFYDNEDSLCPKWFRFYADLENQNDAEILEQSCQNGCGPEAAFNFYSGSANAPPPAGSTQGSGSSGSGSGDSGGSSGFYGCIGGACVPILWEPARPGPACDPNFQNANCYGQCANPANVCQPWD